MTEPREKRVKDSHWFTKQAVWVRDHVMSQFPEGQFPRIAGGISTGGDRAVAHVELWYCAPDPAQPTRAIDNDEGVICFAQLTPQEEETLDRLFVSAVERLSGFTFTIGRTVVGRREYKLFPPDSACKDAEPESD